VLRVDLKRFFQIGFGSACELEYQFLLAHDLEFLNDSQYEQLAQQVSEIKKMLATPIVKLKQ
jgi:four helix bundle protein